MTDTNLSKLGPYNLNEIYTGDAKILAKDIPDESVDLVFCDPIYQNIADYAWLAETAARVLKPGGNGLAFVNAKWFPFVFPIIGTILPPLAYIQTSGLSPMNGRVIAKTYYLIWFGSGKLAGYMPDGYIGTTWSKANLHNFKWTKSPKYIKTVFRAFTRPEDIIVDFFCGGGTVPAVAKMLGLDYWACEIDPPTAARARQRVEQTQPPLFVMQPEQAAMELA